MRSGGMRHIIKILTKTSVKNEYGELETSWETCREVKAQVTKVGGNKTMAQGEVSNSNIINVEVWNHHNITEINRIEWRGNVYSVDFIEPSYDDIKQKIQCTRISE